MMRPALFLHLALASIAYPMLASAQTPPADTPPRLEKLEEGEQPAITIRKPEGERQVTQKREGGVVTEVKVKSGKSEYYLKPNNPAGSAMRGDAQSNESRPAQWKVKEFDAGSRNKTGKEVKEAEQTLQPAPAAVPPPPAAKPAK